jgi:hypothetical protein
LRCLPSTEAFGSGFISSMLLWVVLSGGNYIARCS